MIVALAAAALLQGADTADFQQGVDYRIEASLDDRTSVLTGRARLRYTNRSGRALDTLYFHQHLNAFRPNSAWARREAQHDERRFQSLGGRDHAFERFTGVRIDGVPVRAVYPGAPDSTVAAVPLPRRLAPGATATLLLDWQARLATLPRRQGRAGRSYDWAHWYPRIAVLDRGGWQTQPLLPQGEFYGEFARFDVTLDVAADQVLGATGVPVAGDPGWRLPGARSLAPAAYRRDAYPRRPAEPLGLLPTSARSGRKQVRWRADDVHHFAWSASPTYRYDGVERFALDDAGGRSELPAIHVLYQPADSGWAGSVARRTHGALTWLQGLFGPYVWPQLTVVRRVEARGGTEFPMLIMNSSPSEGLIVHEVAHQWLHGILGNNEWREGWLDEGLTSYVTDLYWAEHGNPGIWDSTYVPLRRWERSGRSEPVGLAGAAFRDMQSYGVATYLKASVVFRMLHHMVGDTAFRRGLRLYAERNRFRHVDEADFRRAMEEASGRELGWFFRQWLHTTATLDYGVSGASTERLADGRWRTTAEVRRTGDAWMPVRIRAGDAERVVEGRETVQRVELIGRTRPTEVVLDPDVTLLDVDIANNRTAVR